MFSLLAEAAPVADAALTPLENAFQWLPWIILIAALVAVFLAVLVKGIYLFLYIFSKKG